MLEFHEIFHDVNPISSPIFSFYCVIFLFNGEKVSQSQIPSQCWAEWNHVSWLIYSIFVFFSCLFRLLLCSIVIIYHRDYVYIFHFPTFTIIIFIINNHRCNSDEQWRHLEILLDSTENVSFKCIALIKLYCFIEQEIVPPSHISPTMEFVSFLALLFGPDELLIPSSIIHQNRYMRDLFLKIVSISLLEKFKCSKLLCVSFTNSFPSVIWSSKKG